MVYGMQFPGAAIILSILLLLSTGCMDSAPDELPVPTTIPVPVSVTTAGTPRQVVQPADMALQPADLPSDYILHDRSVMALPEISSMARELGWKQGYYVSYYRMNTNTNDITLIWQSVSIYSSDTINGVFLLEKEDLKDQQLSPGSRYEIPFPATGERSIAFRETNPMDRERPVTYTVIFTRADVFEKITMSGTNTDYETLKRLVQRADALIQGQGR
jgi:hypothetical protein